MEEVINISIVRKALSYVCFDSKLSKQLVRKTQKEKELDRFEESVVLFKAWLPESFKLPSIEILSNGPLAYMVKQLYTNFENAIKSNFDY